LATQVASRDLAQLSKPLARAQLRVSASLSNLRPGDPFVFSWEPYGVVQMVMRVAEIDYGTVEDGHISITAVQDAFSLASAIYAPPPPTEWVDPRSDPQPAPFRRLSEATYYHVALSLGDSPSLLSEIDDSVGFLLTQAVRPSGDAFGYEVHVDSGGYKLDGSNGQFCPSATLVNNIGPNDTLLDLQDVIDLDLVEVDTWAYLNNEIIVVRSIDTVNNTVTVDRGMIDTVPKLEHAAGSRIFFGQSFESASQTEYLDTVTISVKMLTKTSRGTLDIDSAPVDQLMFNHRFVRPYPPGNVLLNGQPYPTAITGTPVLTWSHRDRTMQTAELIAQGAGNIGPEPGTTYTIRIYKEGQVLVRTETGLTGTSYTYDEAKELADGGPFGFIEIHLMSVRDGYESWQSQKVAADMFGFGRRFGESFGGLP
jgi:hypothetical protein